MIELLIVLLTALQLGTVCSLGTEIDGTQFIAEHPQERPIAAIGVRDAFELYLLYPEDSEENEWVFFYFDSVGGQKQLACARLIEIPSELPTAEPTEEAGTAY